MATHSSILSWEIPWTAEPGSYSPQGHKESGVTKRLSTAQRYISQTHLIYIITQLLLLWLCRRKITMYTNLFICNLFTFKRYYPVHLFSLTATLFQMSLLIYFVYLKNVLIHRISVHIFVNLKRHKSFARCKLRQTSGSMNMLVLFAVVRITVVLLKCILFERLPNCNCLLIVFKQMTHFQRSAPDSRSTK